jgi:hypothetical protein
MKRKILWILLPILAVGAIAAAVVLLPGRGAGEQPEQMQVQHIAAPSVKPAEPAAPLPASPEPQETAEPLATEKPKFEVSTEGQSSPTEEPVSSGGDWNDYTPPEPQTPVIPGGDEDELPLVP